VGRGEESKQTSKLSIHNTPEYKKYIAAKGDSHIPKDIAVEMWDKDFGGETTRKVPAKSDKTIRVMTWNVHSGQNARDENTGADMVDVITSADPDVICLQEFIRQGPLAKYLYDEYPHIVKCNTSEGISNAIFSKYSLEDEICAPLSDDRVCTKATLVTPSDKKISIYNIHLSVAHDSTQKEGEQERLDELKKLAGVMDSDKNPKILLGDFNAPYKFDKKIQALMKSAKFRNVFPSGGPSTGGTSLYGPIVDYIFYTGVECKKAFHGKTNASDHIPLFGNFSDF
jgi:endonuclease/exonuclease/phosphatase (EEP) superfamily protein YafD